jgi:hypothetical protein
MKVSKFSDVQKAFVLIHAEGDLPVVELCREEVSVMFSGSLDPDGA